MSKFILFLILLSYSIVGWSQSAVPDTKVNHAWVQGVYWNPDELPGWGFFVDVQEETFFGAVYGYLGSNSTFITMQGKMSRLDPLKFEGDVYFVTDGGANVSDVGNFTWSVGYHHAAPAGTLTITSNILNTNNLTLVRFSYAEIDRIDILTGADWNIVEHILITFGENFAISDERIEEEGVTYAMVVNNDDSDDIGLAGYFPPGDGEMYAMMVPLDEDSDNFYVFFASDTNMYGRYWLLDEGESPTGNGYYFHGSIASMQEENNDAGVGDTNSGNRIQSIKQTGTYQLAMSREETKALKKRTYKNSVNELEPMFSEEDVSTVFEKLSVVYKANSGKSEPLQ